MEMDKNEIKERFYSIDDLMEVLGVSRTTIQRWCLHKEIPYYKFGSRIKFEKTEIEKWLEDRKVGCD
jgi:NitT/TauT family transport system substrate-binding protein